MPEFATPEPITATLDVLAGHVRIGASDRTDTVVDVQPSDPSREQDVRAAEQTSVDFSSGTLLIRTPRGRSFILHGRTGSVDVAVELPAGSNVQVDVSAGSVQAQGRLGASRVKTSAGDIRLDETGQADLRTDAGAIVVDRVAGKADITTGSGRIHVGSIDGDAVLKNSNGDNWVGAITGELRVKAANGNVTVDHAAASVTANTANGSVLIGDVVRGTAALSTAMGQIEVGIHQGTAARLDVSTQFGRVRNDLDTADRPASTDETVDIQARTSYGDVVIRRA